MDRPLNSVAIFFLGLPSGLFSLLWESDFDIVLLMIAMAKAVTIWNMAMASKVRGFKHALQHTTWSVERVYFLTHKIEISP